MADVKVAISNNKSVRVVRRSLETSQEEVEAKIEAFLGEKHAYIPDKKYASKYVHRKIKGVEDFSLLDTCMAKQWNLLLRGDTGAGKTMLPMAYAASKGLRYYSIPCDVSIDPSALFGKMMPTDTLGEFEWVDGPVTEMVRYGGVLNISEINFMPAKIAASLYQLLDHRRALTLLAHKGETISAHDELLIVADMNPKYRGTTDLNIALANRFPIKSDWGYDASVESQLIQSGALLSIVQGIRKQDEIRTPVGTNAMQEFEEIAPALGIDFAVENFIAMFAESERDPVKKTFDISIGNVRREIAAIQAGKKPDEELEEMADAPEWYRGEGDPYDYEFEDDDE